MRVLRQTLLAVLHDRRGVTAMEYGMIAAATIVAIAGFMTTISGKLSTIFNTISTSL